MMDERELLNRCLTKGRHILPKPYPTIYDQADQLSDFAYGLILGMNKMHKYPSNLSDEKRIEYLIRNALLYVKAKRFKALRKNLVMFCQCGKRLSKRINSFSQVRPCHGTVAEVQFRSFVVYAEAVTTVHIAGRAKSWIHGFDTQELSLA